MNYLVVTNNNQSARNTMAAHTQIHARAHILVFLVMNASDTDVQMVQNAADTLATVYLESV